MATIGQRITDLIGSDYETIPANSKSDLMLAAVNEVVDMLPSDLLLKYCAHTTALEDANGMDATEEKKILLVTREIANSGLEVRECTAVPLAQFLKCADSGSIYFATAESPVYTYDAGTANDVKLKVLPVPSAQQAAKIYHYNYPTSDISGDDTIAGLPNTVLQAVVLKMCINILNAYISDFVQDEEDTELQQMLTAQMQLLQTNFANEMKRFMEQDATPRGE